MASATLEKPDKTIKFDSLALLREELGKKTKNQERLGEFQKTIDEALKVDNKKGVIEFTEDEWNQLIGKEGLPPIEEVRPMLEKRLRERREITQEAKEGKKWLIDTIKGTANTAKHKVEEIKDATTDKISAFKEKAEKLKKYTKPGLFILGIWLSLKIWGYKAMNWLTGLFGSKGDYDKDIEKLVIEQEFLKDPEAALKKYGTKISDTIEQKWQEKKEKPEDGVLEKVWPIAALWWIGVLLFKWMEKILPTKMVDSLSDSDKKSFLGKLAKNRALKLFGIGGVTLFGLGKLSEYINNNGSALGVIPTDIEGKQSWWKIAIEKAGIGAKDWAEEILALLNGSTVEGYLEEKWPRPWYQFLEESDLLKSVKWKIRLLADKLELIFKKDPKKFEAAFAGISIFKTWLIIGALWAGVKWLDLVRTVLKALYGSAKNHPLLWSLELALLGSEVEGVKHIQIPEWMTLEKISETITDLVSIEGIHDKINTMAPGFTGNSVQKTAEYLENNCEKLSEEIDYISSHWQENLDAGMRNLLVVEWNDKVNSSDKIGFEAFQKDLHVALWENKINGISALIGEDKKSGIIGTIIDKLNSKNTLEEADIHNLIIATEGTKIRIFPAWETKEWDTIQWVLLDENGNPDGPAKNICINPTKELNEKVTIADDFIYDPTSLWFVSKFSHEVYNEGRDLISDITKSITSEPGKAKSGIDKIIGLGWSVWYFGGKMFIEYLNQVYIVWPANLLSTVMPGGRDITGQEFLVNYAGGMVPVLFINSLKRSVGGGGGILWKWFGRFGWKVIAETALYPIKWPADVGKYIYTKYNKGLLSEIIKDPAILIRDQFYRIAGKIPGASVSTKRIRDLVSAKEKMGRLNEKLLKANRLKKIEILQSRQSGKVDKMLKEAREIFGTIDHTKHTYFSEIEWKNFNVSELEKLIKMNQDGINSCTQEINQIRGKTDVWARSHTAEHPESLRNIGEQKVSLDPGNPNHKKMMDNFMEKSRGKLAEIETERAEISKQFQNGKITQAHYDEKMKVWTQREWKIMRLQEHIHLKLHWRPLHGSAKLGRFGRGLAGLVLTVWALIGTQMAIEKWKTDNTSIEIPELDSESDEKLGEKNDAFYGFKEKENQDKKKVESSPNNIDSVPENIAPFLEKIEAITAQYQLSFFSDPEAIARASDDTIETNIHNIEKLHWALVLRTKSLLKEYKEPLKAYWAILKTQWEAINIKSENLGHLNAFMAITEKSDGLYLESMDKNDVNETLWWIVDGVKNGWIGHRILETGMWLLPVTAEIQDAQYAYREFSRGHIGDGFVHVGFLALDTVLDVSALAAGILTAPAAWAGWVAVEAWAIGLRWAIKWWAKWVAKKAIKWLKFEKMQWFVRVLGESEKFKKHIIPWLWGVRWKALRLPSGDLVNFAIDMPRSESVNIESL